MYNSIILCRAAFRSKMFRIVRSTISIRSAHVNISTTSSRKPVGIITGSSSGLGQDIARELTRQGYALTLCGRNENGLETTKSLCLENGASQEDLLIIQGDLTTASEPERLVSLTAERFGRINALINNAGFSPPPDPRYENLTAEQFDHIASVNLRAPMILTKSCIPYLSQSKGTVINMSSCAVNIKSAIFPLYGTLKAALDYFTESAACAYGPMGIRVCGIRPGYVSTPIEDVIFPDLNEDEREKMRVMMLDSQTLKRRGEMEDVSNMVAFLLSDKASFVTGVNINVDGGLQFQIRSE